MASITDEKGYNQSYKPSLALTVRTERRAQKIVDEIRPLSPKKIIEFGCGTAELSRFIASQLDAQIVATDISEKMLDIARKESNPSNLIFSKADLMDPKFYQDHMGEYDAIVGNGVIHHLVTRIDELAPLFFQLLKPGGKFVFWEPNISNPYVFLIFKFGPLRKLAKLDPDEMAFGSKFIEEKLAKAGFKVKVDHLDFLVPNTPDFLIRPLIKFGSLLEQTPAKSWSQSLFISAEKII